MYPQGTFYYQIQTWIEFAHRVKSGLFGILIVVQTIWGISLFRGNKVFCSFQLATLLFTISEALLGALLVLGGYVEKDDSIGRLIVISFHLGNTLALVGALTIVWRLSTSITNDAWSPLTTKLSILSPLVIPFLLVLAISVTGAWAALSTTLFPVTDLAAGLQADFASSSHYLVRLRIIHPLIAVIGSMILWIRYSDCMGKLHHVIWIQAAFGLATLSLHSPIWMKLTHLTIAEIVWITLITKIIDQTKRSNRSESPTN